MNHDASDVTVSELYRLVKELKMEMRASNREQNLKLDAIESEVRKTNGNVIAHDGRLTTIERDRDFARRSWASPSETPKGTISFSWAPDTKTVLTIASGAATVIALLLKEWFKK